MFNIQIKSRFKKFNILLISLSLILSFPLHSYAGYAEDADFRKTLPVQSNEIENWPEGPLIGAGSAVLMDADSGIVLYEKNMHDKMYPASTTKLMTCLLAMESDNVSLSDSVSFSYDAVFSVTRDASNMGMDVGEAMSMEDCLYGILVLSANEVCNAVAEHVSGSIDAFVSKMNDKAVELGCNDTHFNNAHGYTDPDHYTSAYDLALIGREFFKNELLSKISRTPRYHWYPSDTQPDDIELPSTNYFLRGFYECDGIVGSKTGFTDESRQVLVTAAERNGMRLIAVIMQEETPYQYEDTLDLLNYGFSNFTKINISDYETKYTIKDDSFFKSDKDLFGDSSPIIYLDSKSTMILPRTVDFNDIESTLTYSDDNSDYVATIDYNYNGKFLGSGHLTLSDDSKASFVFNETAFEDSDDGVSNKNYSLLTKPEDEAKEPTFIYVNNIIFWVVCGLVLLFLIIIIRKILSNFHFARKRREVIRRVRRNSSSYKPYEISKKSGKKKPFKFDKFERF